MVDVCMTISTAALDIFPSSSPHDVPPLALVYLLLTHQLLTRPESIRKKILIAIKDRLLHFLVKILFELNIMF